MPDRSPNARSPRSSTLPTLPRVPEYWRATPGEDDPSLTKPGSLDDPGLRVDQVDGCVRQDLPDRFDWPGGCGDELLEALVVHAQAHVQRLHGFTSAIEHESLQVEATGGSLILTCQRSKDLGDVVIKLGAKPSELCGLHTREITPIPARAPT